MRASAWRTWTVTAVVAAVLLGGAYAAWSTRGDGSNDAGWLDSLDGVQGEWVSNAGYAYDGTTPWTAPVRLTVTDDNLDVYAGCNRLSARVTVEDHRLSAPDGVAATEIGCPAELVARDAWLAALIDDRATVQLKGPMLALDTDAGWIGFVRSG